MTKVSFQTATARPLLIGLVVMLAGCAATPPHFVPRTYLTPEEQKQQLEDIKEEYGWTDENIERMDFGPGFRYRQEDIRAAFPELSESDEFESFCSNSVASGATKLVFVSAPVSADRVMLKTSTCSPVENGLKCNPMESVEKYFYKSPENRFEVSHFMKLEEALKVLRAFEQNGIAGLPKWYEGLDISAINRIDTTQEGYQISYGDIICTHCTGKIIVRLENETQLVYVDVLDSICV